MSYAGPTSQHAWPRSSIFDREVPAHRALPPAATLGWTLSAVLRGRPGILRDFVAAARRGGEPRGQSPPSPSGRDSRLNRAVGQGEADVAAANVVGSCDPLAIREPNTSARPAPKEPMTFSLKLSALPMLLLNSASTDICFCS